MFQRVIDVQRGGRKLGPLKKNKKKRAVEIEDDGCECVGPTFPSMPPVMILPSHRYTAHETQSTWPLLREYSLRNGEPSFEEKV